MGVGSRAIRVDACEKVTGGCWTGSVCYTHLVDPAVAAVGVLHDNTGDAVALADKLHGRSGEAQLEIVVLLGHFLHFQAHVDARVAGAHAGIRR